MKANEILILSYINKYKRIDLYELQNTINEPLVHLTDCIDQLFRNGYIWKDDYDKFYLSDKASGIKVDIWNEYTLWGKNTKNDFFNAKKVYEGGQKNKLPVFNDVKELSKILQLEHIDIYAYHTFNISQGEKERTIMAPGLELKERQRWILTNILNKVDLYECVHGFVKGRSIKTNAEKHINKKEILCLDIKNFFPTIQKNIVLDIFKSLHYVDKIAELLTELTTFNGVLPQGAPTSPYLANIAFESVDEKLISIALDENLEYTRYADDLTFSADFNIEPLVGKIIKTIEDGGFTVNNEKTHIMKDKYRKIVTGLVVNDKGVKVPADLKKKLRQEIYYCKKFGISQHLSVIGRGSCVNFKEYLYGKAYYIKMIERDIGETFLKQLDDIFKII